LENSFFINFDLEQYNLMKIVTGVFKENCYILVDKQTKDTIIFDPGDDLENIKEAIRNIQGKVKGILLTHGHFDHVGQVAALVKEFNTTAKVHKNDQRLMRQAPIYAIRYISKVVQPPLPFEVFEDESPIQLGSLEINVTHTPGHTMGCVCFQIGKILITGDSLFKGHIGPTNYPESNAELLPKSIERLLTIYKDETLIFPGHGKEWSIGEAKAWWKTLGSEIPQYQIMNDKELRS